MLKWVILAAVGYMLWRMVQSEKRKKSEQVQEEKENLVASGELAKDPMCGTYVDMDNAIRVRSGEDLHYFCSYECRDKFLNKNQVTDKTEPEFVEKKDD